MGVLKELNRRLADFLQANQHECGSLLNEEFLCCCERARLAIKDFTHEGDATLHHCFLIAGDALCDLQWCWHNLADSIHGEKRARRLSREGFERALFPLVWEIRLRKNQQRPSDYRWDGRNGSGSAHLPPGLNVDDVGEIEYLEDLGAGSQGMVYKARWPIIRSVDVSTDLGIADYIYEPKADLVAVKEVSSGIRSEALESVTARSEAWESLSGHSVSRSNLYCELDVLKTLHHPNIVELKGYTKQVRAEGKYGLVMELMDSSLADLMKTSKKLSDLEMVDTLLQVARGMHFLHMVGIMHRDLKPANILIRELKYLPLNVRRLRYVVAKLADFGLSKGLSEGEDLVAADGAAHHTYRQGTSFYMAPEVRERSNNAGESCAWYAMSADVFSFGTTCFNVLTGEGTPFVQEGHPLKTEQFYRMIERGHLFDFKCKRSKMALLVRQCWCFDPSERPTFLQICQILEDEKRQILCPATPKSPSMSIDKKEEVRGYSSGARNGLGEAGDFDQIEHLSEIEYFHDLGSGAHEMCELGHKVHRAIWRGVHPVAVKEVSSLQLKDLSSRYSDLKMLNHPNVVELKGYTMLRAAGRYGLVTELMWCSFEDVIEKKPITDKRTSINLLLEVARGMEFLHSKGILHLGLKPASILIGPPHRNATRLEQYMVAKITDFWFSDSRVDEAGSHGCDDFYMAPELYNFCKYSATKSADVFSFGTMCFNVLTKQEFPLEISLQSQEFYSRIERGDVDELLRTIRGESEMRRLVRACWCADADSRPPFVEICQILEMEKSRILELVEKSYSRKKQRLEELLCSVKVDEKGQILKLEEGLPRNRGYVQELLRNRGYVLWMKLKVKLRVLKLEARTWKRRSSR